MVPMERVVIRHPVTRGVSRVAPTAVPTWEKRGWLVVTSNDPKPVVLDAAEQLGVAVDPSQTRSTIVDQLATAPVVPPTPVPAPEPVTDTEQ